ncbi:hypothetical protein H6784_05490 [Candidatus Nomurabacteria bacterium]|nr:hypothetical protein [Candidatus Kaiserbacteria bacterium]MCB9814832.1 hypothetical protein [Candidatus Nomurabacteria bacterium]
MFRYLQNKLWLEQTVALAIVSLLFLQIIFPTVVFGMSETIPDNETNTPEESPIETIEPEPDTIVSTGSALSGLEVVNEINTTEINTRPTSSTSSIPETETEESNNATSTTQASSSPVEIFNHIPDTPELLTVESSSSATSSTNATSSATSGNNSASGINSTIVTGEAVAYTDIINVVNTNIVNSDGLVKFVNETLGYKNFDLRNDFDLTYANFNTSQSTSPCSLNGCNGTTNTTVNTSNNADITNNISVTANTGSNKASGSSTNISTGDAYATANIVNVANTNIVDSNYLLLVFNNFSSLKGDIILPSSSFFDKISRESASYTNSNISNSNSATVNNNISTVANTGNNQATGENSEINTGNAIANSDVHNQVNQNIIGGNSFSMLVRVHGDWNGTVSGLPDGFAWRETDRGIEIVSANSNNGSALPRLNQSSSNIAKINNNVEVYALTGDNQAEGAETKIKTGNAYADSSVINIANTNIIGSNWSNLIFNIYGNWTGNLTFGQPNLWLGITADSPDNPIMPGSEVIYTFTVFNQGDTTAPDVKLATDFENLALSFTNNNQTLQSSDHSHTWSIGDIKAGETKEFTRTAVVSQNIIGSVVSAIPLTGRVESSQADADDSDNEDTVTIYTGQKRKDSNSLNKTFASKFDITKTASRDLAQPGDIVDYTITLFNRGGQLYDGLLVDVLEDEEGNTIQENSWPLGDIKNWETITINYSIEFDSSTATGTYTNRAQLVGFHGSLQNKNQTPYESPIAVHKLNIGTRPAGQVLGIQSGVCSPYLTEYMRFGEKNNPSEVIKLQIFLNNHLNKNLPVTGIFDLTTEIAVRDFQKLYADEILTPWGMERDSGFVYYTTQKKINDLMCQSSKTFPLTLAQEQEIKSYRQQMEHMKKFAFNTPQTKRTPTLPQAITPNQQIKPNTEPEEINEDEPSNLPPPVEADLSSQTPERTNPWKKLTNWWKSLSKPTLFSLR